MGKVLHNKINKKELKERVLSENEKRVTISFYTYHTIGNPQLFRDHLYKHFAELQVFGRVYVATEGINAQISVLYDKFAPFEQFLESISFLKGIRLNLAIEENRVSFYVLKIKVKSKIVADGIENPNFNLKQGGEHVDAKKFNELISAEDTYLIDMRNHYESEVGHFVGAWCPDVDTFREQLPEVVSELKEQKDKKIVMYCTGGIRCEKASAYMKMHGFKNVYQLEGGIINYTRQARDRGLENKFIGKNFVFDDRLEERISDDVIAECHQCGKPFDEHTNCKNVACNLLFIQCPECAKKMEGCCSDRCQEIIHLPEAEQKEIRKTGEFKNRRFSKGRFGG